MRSRPSALGISYAAIAVFTALGSTAALGFDPGELPTSAAPVLSADGTKVAFVSWYDRLVPGDTNHTSDVFVRDLVTGAVTRASTTSAGAQSSADPEAAPIDRYEAVQQRQWPDRPALSADGTRVAFLSASPDLVPDDTNGQIDVFVKDLATGEIVRASTAADGAQVHCAGDDPATGANFCTADPYSTRRVALSADGRTVAFLSAARDLVPGDTNGRPDVFVKDLRTGAVTRASTTATGRQFEPGATEDAVALSADGSTVAFISVAGTLTERRAVRNSLYVRNLRTGTLIRRTAPGKASITEPSLSADGTKVAFLSYTRAFDPNDHNKNVDVFVEDLRTRTITRVSLTADGKEFRYGSSKPLLSPDGTAVVFAYGGAANPQDTNDVSDVFVKDLRTGALTPMSTSADGTQLSRETYEASLSNRGKTVAFTVDTNAYVRDANRLLRLTPHPDDSSFLTRMLHRLYD